MKSETVAFIIRFGKRSSASERGYISEEHFALVESGRLTIPDAFDVMAS